MSWNYRIIKDHSYYLAEVFYDGKQQPDGWTGPLTLSGESLEELRTDFLMMASAFTKPVLLVTNHELIEEEDPLDEDEDDDA